MLDVGASQFPFKQNDLQFDTESKGPLSDKEKGIWNRFQNDMGAY